MASGVNNFPIQAAVNPRLNTKDGFEKTALDHVITFGDTAYADYRIMSLLEKTCKFASICLKDMGNSAASFCEGLAGKFGIASAAIVIVQLPRLSNNALNASGRIIKPASDTTLRTSVQDVHDVAEGAAAWGYATSFVTGSGVAKIAADVASLASDVTDLEMLAEDVLKATDYLSIAEGAQVDEAVVQRIEATRNYAMIKAVKAITSVASGVIGLLVLTLGGPILPAAFMVGMGLVGSVAALWAHFFRETCAHELVDFAKIV